MAARRLLDTGELRYVSEDVLALPLFYNLEGVPNAA
jgi:hypothetical protein